MKTTEKQDIILGITDNHEAGAALFRENELLAAVSEERLNRRKNSNAFPLQSIETVLRTAGVRPEEVGRVAVGSRMTPTFLLRLFKRRYERFRETRSQFSYFFNLYMIYSHIARTSRAVEGIDVLCSRGLIRGKLRDLGIEGPMVMVDHHLAHAYSTYYTAKGIDRALILTVDAMGDGLTLSVSTGEGDTVTPVYRQDPFSAISSYYSRLTEYLGFKPIRDEGKVMSLAAKGDPDRLLGLFKEKLHFKGGGFNRINYFLKQTPSMDLYRSLRGEKREDICAAAQKNLEEEFVKFVTHWAGRTGMRNVVCAGGLFANVKLNQRILEQDAIDSIYIYPNMTDGGLCAGAPFHWIRRKIANPDTMFHGPSFSAREITDLLDREGVEYRRSKQIEKEVAGLLAQGKIVGRLAGRMEFGPRALGNRTVLYQPTDPTLIDWFNKRLKRSTFMPFAPATLIEHADQCYLRMDGATFTARFMNISFDCTDWMVETCPGVVHTDRTARPQLVDESENPGLHRIIEEYRRITGLPSVVNTSFNIHEEPIVCSPEEALLAFRQARLDYLVLEDFLIPG